MSESVSSSAPRSTVRSMTWLATGLVVTGLAAWLVLRHAFGVGFYSSALSSSGLDIEQVSVPVPGGKLAATLFRPQRVAAGTAPGIVLVHGTSASGRSLLLYQILGRRLALRGAVVLLYDQRGFGESPDPIRGSDGHYALPWVADAIQATRFLREQPGVDGQDVRLLGHSFGGSVAIGVSQARGVSCLLGRILVFSPGRGLNAGGADPFAYRAERLSTDMALHPPLTADDARRVYASMEVQDLIAGSAGVPTVLLHTSAEEATRPLAPQLSQARSQLEFKILPGTSHYLGTNRPFNSRPLPVKLYDAAALEVLLDEVLAPAPLDATRCASEAQPADPGPDR